MMAEDHQRDNGDDFELEEEEYADQDEQEEDLANTNHPQQWWSSVNEACNDVDHENEDSEGFRSESELESLHNDAEGETRIKKREFNPHSNMAAEFTNVMKSMFYKEVPYY